MNIFISIYFCEGAYRMEFPLGRVERDGSLSAESTSGSSVETKTCSTPYACEEGFRVKGLGFT